MRLAFTYDLKSAWRARGLSAEQAAEFDCEITVEAIAGHFAGRGFTVDPIGGAHELLARLAAGDSWDLAFNICEGFLGSAREALVPALFEHLGIPCVFSDAATLALCLRKDLCKQVVRDAGVPTPAFAVLEAPRGLGDALAFPVFAKPLAEGTGKGVGLASRCADEASLARTVRRLLEKFRQPVLVEAYLPGREFTVGIVGTGAAARAIGCMEVAPRSNAPLAYGFVQKQDWRTHIAYRLADDAEAAAASEVALAAWRALGCRDGGRIDLRSDESGRPHFIECNPLAGLNPEDSDLVIMGTLAGREPGWLYDGIMDAALARLDLAWPQRAAA
ncbi:MAG: D-alanine--D-alanine ligase [Acetobacteraceae bacterium]|nr:D-alanine--D-alanine ligase [Acetobacteraceae bacterium]